ncbi:phosphoglycolate phosphatase [Loktanella sp. DSM 29012]|uniref:HAD-IA family hydrolase n=1 Tax=Loktanella sp. DSM 29012 TaxID=1881056 RepID=UPI0008B53F8F|nr:HAD-IA family hydrolase [Loktanella sp. DSM 29012]SEQ28071.1 phosphoglycolate phosphatase [Loktanella sp. DSM 29012]
MRCVVFDLDGTLADTSGDLIAAANACFADLGHAAPLDAAADGDTAVRGARAMLRLGFARIRGEGDHEADVDAQYQPLLDHYSRDIASHTYFYDGALDAISRLRAASFRVAICTNKPGHLTDLLLDALDARDHFDAVVAADTLTVSKPDPAPFFEAVSRAGGDPARAFLIGDTQTDRDTARAAGVPIVLVSFGPAGARVLDMAHDVALHSYAELDDVAVQLLGR